MLIAHRFYANGIDYWLVLLLKTYLMVPIIPPLWVSR